MKYAIQTLFIYGWDYTGAEDGERLLFDTEQEAREDLNCLPKAFERAAQNCCWVTRQPTLTLPTGG